VRLACRAKIRLDTQVNLQIPAFEPTPAAFCQMGRFRDLRYSQHAAVEAPGEIFAARRHRQLHMLDTRNSRRHY